MANTVSLLSYANTFGDWVITTNALAKENNTLASSNYIKNAGTLYLNDPLLGLQVANNAVVAGQLQVQGVGSSAYVQNNLRVNGQVYFTNPTLGLTNYGQANIGGPLLALGGGTGLAVSNNATIGGNVSSGGFGTFGNYVSVGSFLSVAGNASVIGPLKVDTLYGNSLQANTGILTPIITITNRLDANAAPVSYFNNLITSGQLIVGGNFVITGSTVYNSNTLTINAGSAVGQNSLFTTNRGVTGANASIRWNEASQYWDLNDVNNGNFYKILTGQSLSDLTNLNSSGNVATSAAVYSVNNLAATVYNQANVTAGGLITANANIVYTDGKMQAAYAQANVTAGGLITANANIVYTDGKMQAAYAQANITAGGLITANANSAYIQSGLNTANSNISILYGIEASQNANIISLQTAANTDYTTLTAPAGVYGNSTFVPVITLAANGRITSVTNTAIIGAGGSSLSASGFLPNAIIYANTGGYLSNTSNLQYLTSNNTVIASNIAVSGTVSTPKFKAYTESMNVVGVITTSTYSIDLSQGNIFDLTANANITFTFTNPPPAGTLMTSTIILRQDVVGGRLCTFANAKYTDGYAPVLTTIPSKADVLTFFTVNSGITYFGSFAMANVAA